ncbi:MAG: AraC family transcriptional regulator [Clostridia bacterium]|nr:AraC family transcriptional regulator [Clostridia bacterium]
MAIHQEHNSVGSYIFNEYTYVGTDWEPHYHKSYEAVTVIEGTLDTIVNGKEQTLFPGDYLLVLPDQIHAYSSRPDTVYWVAVFSEDFVPKFATGVKGRQGKSSVFKLDNCIDNLVKSTIMGRESSLLIKKACLYAICDSYLKNSNLENRKTSTDNVVSEIIDYVSTHYSEDITLSLLAEKMGYEYHYLSRLLEKNYKIKFRELLNKCRLENAIDLLQTTDLNMTEIAIKSGFKSIRSFNYVFAQYTGKTPREVRSSRVGSID